jgi:hypothetical protein
MQNHGLLIDQYFSTINFVIYSWKWWYLNTQHICSTIASWVVCFVKSIRGQFSWPVEYVLNMYCCIFMCIHVSYKLFINHIMLIIIIARKMSCCASLHHNWNDMNHFLEFNGIVIKLILIFLGIVTLPCVLGTWRYTIWQYCNNSF